MVKEYDCAIFLLTPNDVLAHRGSQHLVARDNVLFEAGLFLASSGANETFLIVPEGQGLKLPSDLDGLNKLTYNPPESPSDLDAAVAPACNEIIEFLENPLPPVL
jgi:predicted nucleotide-binding protein